MTTFALVQLDAVEFLRRLGDESVDLITTDCAYESLEKHRAVGTTTRLKVSAGSSNEWFPIFKNDRFEDLFREMFRVLKKDAHLYFFCDQETMFIAKPVGEKVGFKFWKPLVWDKLKIGMGYHYRARYEFVLFFEKGKRRLNDLGVADVLPFARVHAGYPTEKPVGLNEVFVKNSSNTGEIVIDPFMGSGSAGEAALKNGRVFYGNDISEASLKVARPRLLQFGSEISLPEAAPPSQTSLFSTR